MSDPTPNATPSGGTFTGRKIAGMPRPVFIIGLGSILGLGWWYYNKRKAAVSGTAPVAANGAAMPAGASSPNAGSGAASGGSNPGFPTGVSTFATNAQWASAAANYLSAQGVPPTTSSNALTNLLNGTPLTAAQQALINQVEGALGVPPEGVVGSTTTPGSYTAPSASYVRYLDGTIAQQLSDGTIIPFAHYSDYAAAGSPKYTQLNEYPPAGVATTASQSAAQQALSNQGAGTGSVLYRVQLGDSLQSISQRYYNTPNNWQQIYNANKAIIGSDPEILHLGSVLSIPGAS